MTIKAQQLKCVAQRRAISFNFRSILTDRQRSNINKPIGFNLLCVYHQNGRIRLNCVCLCIYTQQHNRKVALRDRRSLYQLETQQIAKESSGISYWDVLGSHSNICSGTHLLPPPNRRLSLPANERKEKGPTPMSFAFPIL